MGSRCDNSNDGNSGSGNHYPFHRNYHLFFVNRDFIPRSKYYKDFSHCDLPKTSCRCSSNSYQGPPPERYPELERDNDFREPGGCCKGYGRRNNGANGNSPYPRLPSWMAPGHCSSTRQTYSFNPTTFTLRGYESFNPFSPSYGTPDPYFGKSNSNFDPSNNPSPVHNDRPDKDSPDNRSKQGNGPARPSSPAAAGVTGGKKITSNFDAWATPIDTPNASTSSISINKINSRDNLNSNKKNQKQPNAKGRNLTSASPGNPERLVTAFDAWATPSQISITSSRSSTLNSKTNLNSSKNQRQPNPGPDPKFQTLTSPGNSSQTRDRGGTDATTTTPRKEDASQGTTMTIAPMISTRATDYKNADYSSPTKSAYTSTPQPQREAHTQASPENAAIFSDPDKGNTNLPPDALGLGHTEEADTGSPFNEGKQRAEPSADGVVAPSSKTVPPQSNIPLPPSVVPKKAILKNRAIPGQEPDTSRESTTSQTQTTNGINASSSSSIVDSVTKKVRISDRKTVDRESNTVSTPLLSTATATATATTSKSPPKTEPLNNQIESDGNTSRNSAGGKGKASNTEDGNSQGKSGNLSDNGSGKGGEISSDHIETIIPPEAETESKKVPDPATTAATVSRHSRGTSSTTVPAKSLHDAFGTRISDVPAITKIHQKWVEDTKKDKATTPAPTPQASTTVSNSDQEKEKSYTVNVVELPGLSKAEFFQNALRNQGSGSDGEGKQRENYNNGGAMDDSGGISSAVSINNETSTPSNESTQLNTPVPVPAPGEGKYQYGQSEYAVTSPANFILSDLIPEPIGELQSFKLNQTSPKAEEIKMIPAPTASEAPTRANKLKQQLDKINASLIGPRLNSGGNRIADADSETYQHQQQNYNKSDQIPPNEATAKTRAEVKPRFLPGTKTIPLSSQILGTKESFQHQSVDQKEFPKASSRQDTTPLQETPTATVTAATTATEGEEPWEWLVGGVSSPRKTSRTPVKPPGGSQPSTSNASPAKNSILENALTLMKKGPSNQTRNRLADPDSDSKDGSDTRIGTSDDVVETHPPNNLAPLKNGRQEHFTAKIPNRNSSTINNLSNHERIQSESGQNSKLKSNKTEINPRMSYGSGRLIGNEASFNPHKGQKTEAESLLPGSSKSERGSHGNTGAVTVPVNASSIEESEVGTTTPPDELAIHRFDKWGTPLSDASINSALRERNPDHFDVLIRPMSQVVSLTNLNTAKNDNGTIDPLNESRQEYQSRHENDSTVVTRRSPVGNSNIAPNHQEPMKVSSRPYSPQPGKSAVPANANPPTAAVAQKLESPQLEDADVPTRSPGEYSRNGSNKQLINRASINSALRERNPDHFDMLNTPVFQKSPVNLNAAENVNSTIDPLNESGQEYQPRGENDSSIITRRSPVGNSKLAPNQQEQIKVSSRQNSPQLGKSAVPANANSLTAAFPFELRLESQQLEDEDFSTRSPVGYSRNSSNKQLINQDSSKSIIQVEDVNLPGVSKLSGKGFASANDTEIEANSKSPGRYFDRSKVPKQKLTSSGQVSVSARSPEAEAETDTTATTGITARTKNALSNNSRPESEETEFSLKSQSPVEHSKTDPNQELTGFTANSPNSFETATAFNPIRLPNSSGSNKLSLGDRNNAARSLLGNAKHATYTLPQIVQQAQESSKAIAIQTSDTETGPVNLNSPKFSNAAVQVYSNKMGPPPEMEDFKIKSPFQNFNKALIQPQDIIKNDKVNSPQDERKRNTGKITPKMFTTPMPMPTPAPTTPPQAESTSTQTTFAMPPKSLPIKRTNRETEVDLSNMAIQNENGHDFVSKKSEPNLTDFFPPHEVERAPRISIKHGRQAVPKNKTSSAIKSSAQPQPLEELEKVNLNKIKNANQRQTQDDYPNQNLLLPGELSPVIESLFFNPLIGQNRSDGNGKNADNTGSQRSSGRQSPKMHISYHHTRADSNTESNAATRRHSSKASPKKKDLHTADAEHKIDEREQFNPDFSKIPEKSIKRSKDPRSQLILKSQQEPTPNEVQKRSLDEAIQTRDNPNKKTNTVKDRDSALTEALNSSTTSKIAPTKKTKGPKSGDCNDDERSWLSRDAVSGMTRTLLNPWYWAAVVGGLVVAGLLYQNCGCGCQTHSSHSTSSSLNAHNPNPPSAAYKGACQGQTHANSLVRVPLNRTNTNPCDCNHKPN